MEVSLSNSYILTRAGSHEQRSMKVTGEEETNMTKEA